mmetsp:Transcript_91597/g.263598  ORF Transcript_91597/g.263598 Transcript_91597/m.263598 type:complete len:113 (+) Transcript_91597:786-1124(+)
MATVVIDLPILSNVSWINASLSASNALVASSRNSSLGFRSTARAMAILCFWPPENWEPPDPTNVSRPSGKLWTNVAWATASASLSSASDASGNPCKTFLRTVVVNRTGSWPT